jgi:hypothetical protein
VESNAIISDVKNMLTNQNINCGSFGAQVNDKTMVGIDKPQNVLSLDWPIVIYISGEDKEENIIAFSRCIAKLVIIEKAESPNNSKALSYSFPCDNVHDPFCAYCF